MGPWLITLAAPVKARIYQLQNLLDEEQLDGATELMVQEQLEALTNPDMDKEQVKRWKRIKDGAPDFFLKLATNPVVQSIAGAETKKLMGLPPT